MVNCHSSKMAKNQGDYTTKSITTLHKRDKDDIRHSTKPYNEGSSNNNIKTTTTTKHHNNNNIKTEHQLITHRNGIEMKYQTKNKTHFITNPIGKTNMQ